MKETLESRICLFIIIVFIFFFVGAAASLLVDFLAPTVDSTVKGGLESVVESLETIYNK